MEDLTSIKQIVERGDEFFKNGKYDDSVDCYKRALRISASSDLQFKFLHSLRNAGNYNEAITHSLKFTKSNPRDARLWREMGLSQSFSLQYSEAVKSFQKALKIDETDPVSWYENGFALFELEKHQDSYESFLRAVEIDSEIELASSWNYRGNHLFDSVQYDLARAFYELALRVDPNYHISYRNIALCYEHIGRYPEAEEVLRKSLTINSKYVDALNDLSRIQIKTDNSTEALKNINRLLKIDPNHTWGLYNKAWIYEDKGDMKRSIDFYNRAVGVAPKESSIWNDLGNAYLKSFKEFPNDHLNRAGKCFDKSISLDSNQGWAYGNKGRVQIQLGNSTEGKKNIKRTIKNLSKMLKSSPRTRNLDILNSRSYFQLLIKDFEQAESSFREMLEIDPKNVIALNGLVSIYSNVRLDHKKANLFAKMAYEETPGNEMTKINYAETAVGMGDYAVARKLSKEILKETGSRNYRYITTFLIILSHYLQGKYSSGDQYLDSLLTLLKKEKTRITENDWNFKPVVHMITNSKMKSTYSILLLSIIDVMEGYMDNYLKQFFNRT